MKKILTTLLMTCQFFALSAVAEVEIVVSLQRGKTVKAAIWKQVLKHSAVQKYDFLFSQAERKILKEMKMDRFAVTYLMVLKDKKGLVQFKSMIQQKKWPLRVDLNDLHVKLTADQVDEFSNLQWSLKNTGLPQKLELDFNSNHKVQGRLGEDIQVQTEKTTGKKTIVAVLDTGIDKKHPDLAANLHRNEAECNALAEFEKCVSDPEKTREKCEEKWFKDYDGNGYPLDCSGWSLLGGINKANIMGRPDFSDDMGHGTHVAGIIGAVTGNKIGVRGCSANNISILPVQVLGKSPNEPIKPLSTDSSSAATKPVLVGGKPLPVLGKKGGKKLPNLGKKGTKITLPGKPNIKPPKKPGGKTSKKVVDISPEETEGKPPANSLSNIVARGVIYAIRAGAQVINFSMGWPQARDSQFMRDVIAEAQKRGILIVAAAGNDSTRALLRPCAYPGVLCVASHGPDGSVSHFSNYGSGVELAAPGLNILSTWPLSSCIESDGESCLRPRRFRPTNGYEFLNGTSQAAPNVSCMAGEMRARGKSAKETYARLIVGARPHQEALPLLDGQPHEDSFQIDEPNAKRIKKWTLAGNADFTRAMKVKAQPLILPASKEAAVIEWDGKSPTLTWAFQLRNAWATTDKEVTVSAKINKTDDRQVRPVVKRVIGNLKSKVWKGEVAPKGPGSSVRNYTAILNIEDGASPSESRIPSELSLDIEVRIAGKVHQRYTIDAEVVVPVDADFQGDQAMKLALTNIPKKRLSTLPIDENYDQYADFADYLFVEYGKKDWTYYLVSQDRAGSPVDGDYKVGKSWKFKKPENDENVREQILTRMDWDFDGESEYILGFYTDKSHDGEFSPMDFYILNSEMEVEHEIHYSTDKAQISFALYWMKKTGKDGVSKMSPAWMGFGKDPNFKGKLQQLQALWDRYKVYQQQDKGGKEQKKFQMSDEERKLSVWLQEYCRHHGIKGDLTDLCVDTETGEAKLPSGNNEIRLYFVDSETNELNAITEYEFSKDKTYQVIDILEPNFKQKVEGRIPVLLAYNRGNKQKPSYIYDFARAEVVDGKVTNFESLDFKDQGESVDVAVGYRNFLDTRVDKIFSLDKGAGQFKGTFWFNEGLPSQQRLTLLLSDRQKKQKIADAQLPAVRGTVDASLWVRAAFWGQKGFSAYVLTNSEIQFHDLSRGEVASTSLERYTFYPGDAFMNLHFPAVVNDAQNEDSGLPALYTTEGSGLNKGVKILLPHYDKAGALIELNSPARLRFQAATGKKGCKPLDILRKIKGQYYFDYHCRDRIVRVPLRY